MNRLTKYISFICKCKFDGKKYNSNQLWNNDKCWCECEKHNASKIIFGILLHIIEQMGDILQVFYMV